MFCLNVSSLGDFFLTGILLMLNRYLVWCAVMSLDKRNKKVPSQQTAVLFEGQLSFKHAENLYHVMLQKYVFGDGKQQAII